MSCCKDRLSRLGKDQLHGADLPQLKAVQRWLGDVVDHAAPLAAPFSIAWYTRMMAE
jgi:hypothetical protein